MCSKNSVEGGDLVASDVVEGVGEGVSRLSRRVVETEGMKA
jgi:predicted RNA-binding protein